MMKWSLLRGYVLWVTVSLIKKKNIIWSIIYSFGHIISHETSMEKFLEYLKGKYSACKECSASCYELTIPSSSSLCNHHLHYCHRLNKLNFETNIWLLIHFKTTRFGRSELNMMDMNKSPDTVLQTGHLSRP